MRSKPLLFLVGPLFVTIALLVPSPDQWGVSVPVFAASLEMGGNNTATETTPQSAMKLDLVVTRIIDAPVDRVWAAWTNPKHVMRWWGPEGYTSPSCQIDLREGGRYVFCMRAPKEMGGQDQYTSGVCKKIGPMEGLEFTMSLSDKDRNTIDPTAVGMPRTSRKRSATQSSSKK